jgi:hypothetical protein
LIVQGKTMTDESRPSEKHETREIIRRAVIVAWGVLLLFPAGFILLFGHDTPVGWYLLGGVVAVFLIGCLLINWVFLKR